MATCMPPAIPRTAKDPMKTNMALLENKTRIVSATPFLSTLRTWEPSGQTHNAVATNTGMVTASSQKETEWLNRLSSVCGNDEELFQRVQPFAGLLQRYF